uniref:Uncharacterized protein n=1 Tax=Fagus sylvatica TaxID=28930 RepID=A0A2N9HLB6_FAGSY
MPINLSARDGTSTCGSSHSENNTSACRGKALAGPIAGEAHNVDIGSSNADDEGIANACMKVLPIVGGEVVDTCIEISPL